MGRKTSNQASLVLLATLAALLSQNLVIRVMSSTTLEDQKNYYPRHGHGGGHGSTPSHGTPSHGTPSHGGGSYGGTPPANCGNPPSGGHTTPTPSTPSGGGGGSYHTPPTTPTPTTPTPTTPSTPTPTPIVNPPIIVNPPATPVPSPPFAFDPNSPPFTCIYWRTHPTLIWAVLGWWGTVGGTLGATSIPGFGSNMSVLQALSNTRTDGFGALYREGTASFLNSMVNRNFPYTTTQVRDGFVGALSSNKAAANQAQLFKLANEGRL